MERPARDSQLHRITAAQRPHSDDLDARIRRYLVSMAVRTACVVLAVVVDGWLRWVFAAGAIGLPYLAVVMANARGERRSEPQLGTPPPRIAGSLPAPPRPPQE